MNHYDRLDSLHAGTGGDLAAQLDIEAGLREILVAAQHHRTGRDLHLDVEAGLRAIAGHGAVELDGSVATWMMALDSARRLTVRNLPVFTAFAALLEINEAFEVVYDADEAVTLHHSTALAVLRPLALALARAVDLVRDLVQDLTRDRDLAVDSALSGALALERDLASVHARVLRADRSVAAGGDRLRVLQFARDLVTILPHYLALARALTLGFRCARDLAGALAHDLADDRCLPRARDLSRARHDFTAADLSHVDLGHVNLIGIRWSTATRWPSDEWRDQALRDSEELDDGTYRIRGGTTNIPTHSA